MQAPPGGPPDKAPPALVAVQPESGSVVPGWKGPAVFRFDEVVAEPVRGGGGGGRGGPGATALENLLLVSPATDPVEVSWHRQELRARPDKGWRPNRIYQVELLPGVADLRNNQLTTGRLLVFSTGPPIPSTHVTGVALQWEQMAALRATGLVEAVLLPDSLPYRAVTDSTGRFRLRAVPAGEYLIWGVDDRNGNRRRDPSEAFDTVRVRLDSTADVTLWAFPHDTLGPRIRTAEADDSLTLKLTFVGSVAPSYKPDTAHVNVVALPDSTPTPVAAFLTAAAHDSARAAGRPADTTLVAPPDTAARPAPPQPDTARRAPPGAPGPAPAPEPAPDTVIAALLRTRPKPSNVLYVRVAAPLAPGGRYLVRVHGVPNLAGVTGETQAVAVVRRAEQRPTPQVRPDSSRPPPPPPPERP